MTLDFSLAVLNQYKNIAPKYLLHVLKINIAIPTALCQTRSLCGLPHKSILALQLFAL